MRFEPPRCPFDDCPSLAPGQACDCRRRGFYLRKLDGRLVQRFFCNACQRSFSTQSFRLDFRLLKPALTHAVFRLLVSKVTLRQAARILGVSRHTIAHRLCLLGSHCHDFQLARLRRAGAVLNGTFQFDELETFEHERRLKPLTVPVLLHKQSYFVLAAKPAPLPARGGLTPLYREKKARLEAFCGRRKSGSKAAVAQCLGMLARWAKPGADLCLETDKKGTYPGLIQKALGRRVPHERVDSKAPRKYGSTLFPINHTLAQMRDGLSRLVRRNWATTKRMARLEAHLWVWIAFRNYVRPVTNEAPATSSAQALGIERRPWEVAELLELRPQFLP
jgi:transposase-like protein